MDDCIFCKIVKGEIPCHKIYEDNQFLGFLDIHPKAVGHCLIIPKKHYRWVYNIENIGLFFEIIKNIVNNIIPNLDAEYISILTMGNDIPHAHVHLIPHYQNSPKLSNLSLTEIADRIKL